MFTKIKLNNIFNTLHSHPGFCFFFLGREIKIYNAGKFQTYNKALLTIVTMLYDDLFLLLLTYALTNVHPSPPHSPPGIHHSTLCF